MRLIGEDELENIAVGSTILGAGGGGDPYVGKLLARQQIREHGPVTMVGLDELADSDQVCFVAGMGAPGVLVEKLPRASEAVRAVQLLQETTGVAITHIAPAEAGGLNAIVPFSAAALGLPVVDADGMGRAFPSLELVTPTLYGGLCTPLAMVDEHGNEMVLRSPSNQWAETIARNVTLASGCVTMTALYQMTGAQAKQWLVPGVLTQAEDLGRLLRESRAAHRDSVEAIVNHRRGALLFTGRVTAVRRANERGWTIGEATITGTGPDQGSSMELRFQNEHLVAVRDGVVVASVPDLIMAMEHETGEPIPAEEIRYGYRVSVVGLPCDHRWRTEAGLAIAGPRAFGYDVDYRPVEEIAARSEVDA
ncbi:DUF917 domain-containing protein [Nakamurella lactea]|uniref:DUF917 domain-containing protein n=1 Tax=Nakamurella lactea TaxID=459515 RepID=UPI00040006CA|nr:DUF917 domain-containing protein [Nakamurella lactea]